MKIVSDGLDKTTRLFDGDGNDITAAVAPSEVKIIILPNKPVRAILICDFVEVDVVAKIVNAVPVEKEEG